MVTGYELESMRGYELSLIKKTGKAIEKRREKGSSAFEMPLMMR